MENNNIFKKREHSLCINKKRGGCMTKATARLFALTDTSCKFLMAFFKKFKGIEMEALMQHIKIDEEIFEQKIGCLAKAGFVDNHKTYKNGSKEIESRTFCLTSEGEQALKSIGYK